MKTRTTIALFILFVGATLFGQQHPNLAKGFSATGVYQFNGFDTISAFNGNLNLRIPLGQTYSVAPGLSYAFALTWNGNQWMSRSVPPIGNADPNCCTTAYPSHRSNAGFGWVLSLGRLYPASNLEGTGDWTYESPDGADHQFFDNLHPEDDGPELPFHADPTSDHPEFSYTRDGSYLRMTLDVVNGRRKVEFPDGTVHTFKPPVDNEGPWLLIEITNQYAANFVRINYDTPLVWLVQDSRGREHRIFFKEATAYDDGAREIVDHVELATFNGNKARYQLTYLENHATARPFWHDEDHHSGVPDSANLWLLQKVHAGNQSSWPWSSIAPQDSVYSFEYDLGSGGFHPGQVWKLSLPTGGTITWSYLQFPLPVQGLEFVYQESSGVWGRRVYARGAVPGVDSPIASTSYKLSTRCDPPSTPAPCLARDSITTIRNYNGAHDPFNLNSPPPVSRSEHYFSVATFNDGNWKADDYGKPFTQLTPNGDLLLSRREFAGTDANAINSTYVRYARDTFPDGTGSSNVRLEKTKTVHDSDSSLWVQTAFSDFDGLGHYRTSETTSSFPNTPPRTTTVDYNSGRGTYPGTFVMFPTNSPWLIGTAASTTTSDSGKIFKSEFAFDSKGFLTRKRQIRDTTAASRHGADLLTVYTPDSRGAVSVEESYGGDSGNVGTQNVASASLGTRIYRVEHSETAPDSSGNWKELSKFQNANIFFRDATIDRNTGQVFENRDTAGVAVSYVFDFMGRMTHEKPTGRAWTTAEYITTGNSEIRLKQFPNGQLSGPSLTSSRYEIDGLGRVTREWTTMPGGSESSREIEYDGLGRRMAVSELGTPSAQTLFSYDALGRPLTVTAPDSSVSSFVYVGNRRKTRTTSIATPLSPTKSVSTIEEYDGHGRLIAVTEPSGPTTASQPNGANVKTEYTYDPADHLVAVKMNSLGNPVQHRFFDYDGRGFLRWESQPESGMTSYEYDARGNVLSKTQGAANTQFDLKFVYDSMGRPTQVSARNPLFPTHAGETEFRVMKEFAYGTANVTLDAGTDEERFSLCKGKLTDATRINYVGGDPARNTISDRYEYCDAAGRKTGRTTTFFGTDWDAKDVSVSMVYDDLDNQISVRYPMCVGCGFPPLAVDRASETRTYDQGRLKSVAGFIGDVTYWPNGMRKLLPHLNGVDDKQEVGAMARPTQIAFGKYDRCVRPSFVLQPVSRTLSPDASVTLTVNATGTAPIVYEWYGDGVKVASNAGDPKSLTISPTVTTEYWVWATNECGESYSQTAKVTATGCEPPSTGVITAVTQPDGSWILKPADPIARQPRTYQWKRLSDNVILGSAETQAVAVLSQTTTFSLTITDNCGSTTSNVTIVVPLTMSSTGLVATANATFTQVTVSWPAVSGATSYDVERRAGTDWEVVQTLSHPETSWVDARPPQKSYAYRVRALASNNSSNYSNVDVATTMAFLPPEAGQPITATVANLMLTAVNKMREAAGWPALSWATVLSPSDPVVAVNNAVTSRHLLACRARMNEARQALGAPAVGHTDADVMNSGVKAQHIREVLEAIQ